MEKGNKYSVLIVKILAAITAVLMILLLTELPRISAEIRIREEQREIERSIYEHVCDIVDAVYADEYDVRLTRTSGLRSIDCTEDFKETCRSMYESGDYRSIYDYYQEQGYAASVPEKLFREWEKSGKY